MLRVSLSVTNLPGSQSHHRSSHHGPCNYLHQHLHQHLHQVALHQDLVSALRYRWADQLLLVLLQLQLQLPLLLRRLVLDLLYP